MNDVGHRMVETNGIRMRIAGMGNGPPVLVCRGFPESGTPGVISRVLCQGSIGQTGPRAGRYRCALLEEDVPVPSPSFPRRVALLPCSRSV